MIVGSNILAGASGQAGYFLNRSVRLRSSASAYFNRTPSVAGNQRTWTWSGWVKRGLLGSNQGIFEAVQTVGSFLTSFRFDTTDTITLQLYSTPTYNTLYTTTAVFRDPSAWYHIVLAFDTTQPLQANMAKLYVNGVQQVFGFTNLNSAIPQNTTWYVNGISIPHYIGRYNAGSPIDGYLTEVNFIDGQALTPTSFGAYNSYGVWSPAKYTGTYGTNGFYLNFQDNSGATATTIGKDSSGNGNNWTPNNISVTAGITYDSMLDVPTLTSGNNANFCTWSPIAGTNISTFLSGGNLNFVDASNSGTWRTTFSTINVATGKYYHEMTFPSSLGSSAGNLLQFSRLTATTSNPPPNTGAINYGLYWNQFGQLSDSTQTISIGTIAANDLLMVAIDVGAGRLWVGKNGTWFSGNPATNTSPSVTWTPYEGAWSQSAFSNNVGGGGTAGGYTNFGQRPFSYTPPTGFQSLNTYNLPTPTIPNGAAYMAATTYTGTGAALSVLNSANTTTGVSFQPDFVWVKGRSGATDHALYDSVRGTTKQLESNTTTAETTEATGLTAFGSAGFTVGALAQMNTNTATYVGWQWKAGGAAVTNTSGSITSQVSANPTAGFSIVTYTGNSTANATVGHGLGITPRFFVVKVRSTTGEWLAYHVSTGKDGFMQLQSTAAFSSSANYWGTTGPTSTTIQLNGGGGVNNNGSTYVAYCFSEIAGYSKFGSYTGNGSADGTFVYLGFRPRWLMIKQSSAAGQSWVIVDTSRDTFNVSGLDLYANLSNAEANEKPVLDILSNGFKLRNTYGNSNTNAVTYIYAAFAENPTKLALAR